MAAGSGPSARGCGPSAIQESNSARSTGSAEGEWVVLETQQREDDVSQGEECESYTAQLA